MAAAVESSLEVFHLATGTREIVCRLRRHFEAPNWSRDGKHFLINSEGLLYRLNRRGGEPVRLDTGPLDALNNDHGLSPDGR
ncbi:MAG: hypothetical protein KGL56_11745, partial [Alphaproteobacteria bacterium]|nr:hypothetical protein [Alphaproteobacteria bacterium]